METVTAADVDVLALVSTSVDARFIYADSDGEPATAPATPTVAAVDGSGTAVTIGAVSAVSGSTGEYSATIAAADNDTVTRLTLTWTVSGIDYETRIDVVGAYPFTLAELREYDRSAEQMDKARLVRARRSTLSELERLTNRSPVPKFAAAKAYKDEVCAPPLYLPHQDIRTVQAVYDLDETGAQTAWTAGELSYLDPDRSGRLRLNSGSWGSWGNRFEYTYGLDSAPEYLRNAMMLRCVWWATQNVSTMLERTTSWSTGDGGTYRLDSASEMKTGMPNVDAAYARFRRVPDLVVA